MKFVFFAFFVSMSVVLAQEEIRNREEIEAAFQSFECVSNGGLGNRYIVPHPLVCDQFYRCFNGNKDLQVCRDDYGLDLKTGRCRPLEKVDCGQRKLLFSKSHDNLEKCPTRNGQFPLEGQCTQFTDCRDGQDYLMQCSAGSVFDTELRTCIHPDLTTREECKASKFLDFECPEVRPDETGSLPFGDHNRVAHPEECNKFYSCDIKGEPRLNGCAKPMVFDPQTGFCTRAELVAGCEHFYGDNDSGWKINDIF